MIKVVFIVLAFSVCIDASVLNRTGMKLCGSELTTALHILCSGAGWNSLNLNIRIPEEMASLCCSSSCSSSMLLSFCPTFDAEIH